MRPAHGDGIATATLMLSCPVKEQLGGSLNMLRRSEGQMASRKVLSYQIASAGSTLVNTNSISRFLKGAMKAEGSDRIPAWFAPV